MSDEKAIFEAASEIPDKQQRDDYLRQACGDDSELRARVEKLLVFCDEDSPFLSESKLLADRRQYSDSLIGKEIDRYTIVKELGEGGFGVVYLAEQSVPVRRTVALKIIKPGMDTREVVARFSAERQALAMMEHPNIARVLDGGETEHGRPFFVMELVDGVPITEYCDANQMTTQQRLNLFIKVCNAVQHAHQKGIIHRDIKPSNVLVTSHDGEAAPRIIDFGVAKALGQQLTEDTLFTRHGQVVGTPQYMSPEQAEKRGLDVDTRSDIYSLGVLLYELLTGKTPFDKTRLKEAAFDELVRIVRDEEPPMPSSRISTLGAEGAIVGQQRSTEPLRLERLLRGDIDWIVMRALEKDRKRRFETVGDFVADIERHLVNEPVLSGPPSTAYRASKFVRRNRIGLIVACAVAGAVAAGLVIALIGLSRANAERHNAQTVLAMLRDMLATDRDAGRGRDLTVRTMLDDFSASLPDLSGQPRVAAEIQNVLANSYYGLDLFDEALDHFHEDYRLKRQIYGETHAQVALTAKQISQISWQNGDDATAREYGEIAISIFDTWGDYSEYTMWTRSMYCEFLAFNGEPERAEAILRRTIREFDDTRDSMSDAPMVSIHLRRALSVCLAEQGEFGESLRVGKLALDDRLSHPMAGDSSKGYAIIRYGDCLDTAGKTSEAIKYYEKAMELLRRDHDSFAYITAVHRCVKANAKLFRYDEAIELRGDPLTLEYPHAVAIAFSQLAFLDLDQGNYDLATRRCQEMLDRIGDSTDMAYPRTVAKFLMALSQRRRSRDACDRICDDMLSDADMVAASQPETRWLPTFSLVYSWVLLNKSARTPDEAREALRHAKDAVNASEQEYLLAFAHNNLALAYLANRDSQGDTERMRLAIEHQQLAIDKMPEHHLFLRAELDQTMASLLEAAQRVSEARKFLEQAVNWRKEVVPAKNIHIVDARMRLAEHLIKHGDGAGDLESAEEQLLEEINQTVIEARPPNDVFRTRWVSLLIDLYDTWEKPVEREKWEQTRSNVMD